MEFITSQYIKSWSTWERVVPKNRIKRWHLFVLVWLRTKSMECIKR